MGYSSWGHKESDSTEYANKQLAGKHSLTLSKPELEHGFQG